MVLMMRVMMIFGLGYCGQAIARRLFDQGWQVESTGTHGTIPFDDTIRVHAALTRASAILSTVAPADGVDPVLERYGAALHAPWIGYLSSTGVYGDCAGAWVDETALVGAASRSTRRSARAAAEAQWLELGAHAFRLPGIYGPGRSAFDRLRGGRAHRIDLPDQVFSRIHVEDIASAVMKALDSHAPPGPWNIADDAPCHQNAVIEEAARLMGVAPPPLVALDTLSEASRGFYAENRRVANGRARRLLGWAPRFGDYRAGLRDIWEREGRG
jgi:nucleoside-diphosphate-sugar epimerase